MTEYDQEFLEKLKQLCMEYDTKYGEYAETKYQGLSLYDFAAKKKDKSSWWEHEMWKFNTYNKKKE
ncbi:MAG: hypothetical protein ABFC34_15490 [Methanobacterium sp.]